MRKFEQIILKKLLDCQRKLSIVKSSNPMNLEFDVQNHLEV